MVSTYPTRTGADAAAGLVSALRSPARSTLVRAARERGAMTPLYASPRDEVFHVLEGDVTFFVGADTIRARPGDVVVAPAGVARTLRVESGGARWLAATEVASAARYDDFGRALARGAGAWATAQDEATVTSLGAANGLDVIGAPGALPASA